MSWIHPLRPALGYPGLIELFRVWMLSWQGKVLVDQSCLTLCHPMDCSRPGSSVCGITQARILEWVVVPSSMGSYWSRNWTLVSHIAGRFFTIWATWEAQDKALGLGHKKGQASYRSLTQVLRSVFFFTIPVASFAFPPAFDLIKSISEDCVICIREMVNTTDNIKRGNFPERLTQPAWDLPSSQGPLLVVNLEMRLGTEGSLLF